MGIFSENVAKAMYAIHDAKVEHRDLDDPRNIVKDGQGRPWIVDFDRAIKMRCDRKQPDFQEVNWGEVAPLHTEYACSELYEFMCALEAWKPLPGQFFL